jgi:hypothetical protein
MGVLFQINLIVIEKLEWNYLAKAIPPGCGSRPALIRRFVAL